MLCFRTISQLDEVFHCLKSIDLFTLLGNVLWLYFQLFKDEKQIKEKHIQNDNSSVNRDTIVHGF